MVVRAALVGLTVLGACSFQATSAGQADAPPHDGGLDVGDGGGGSGSSTATARRIPLTIPAMTTMNLDNFDLYVDLSNADLAANARADGTDIFFTDSNGVALKFERERWSGGRLLAWVLLPHIDMTAPLTIYVEYGDLSRATASDPRATFPGYVAVWHLDDTLATATVADAIGTHAGSAVGLAPTDQMAGKLGGAIDFDGTGNERIDFTNMLVGTGPHTISAWVDQKSDTHISAIVAVGTNATDQARFVYGAYGGNGAGVGLYNDDWTPSNADIQGAGWTLVHFTYEGMNKKGHLFINGVEVPGGHTFSGMASTPAGTGHIGYAPEPAFGMPTGMLGKLDEVRIGTFNRGPAWCAAEFANQSSPATFYMVGAAEPAP